MSGVELCLFYCGLFRRRKENEQRKFTRWSKDDTETVRKYFREYLMGRKQGYPGTYNTS